MTNDPVSSTAGTRAADSGYLVGPAPTGERANGADIQPPSHNQPPTPSSAHPAASAGWLASIGQALGLTESPTLRRTIEEALRAERGGEGTFSVEERAILLRVLKFSECRVEDVMVPRADIIAVEESEPVSELLRTFQEAGVSRIPVFAETLDDPRGMVHIKDLVDWMLKNASLDANGAAKAEGTVEPSASEAAAFDLGGLDLSRSIAVTKIRRPVLYVPLSMPAMNLLIRMQTTRIHMALVIDEYGGTDGLVTIEDLIEQIVGDIEDEHDETEEANIKVDPKLGLIASARTPVEELETHLGRKLLTPEEDEEIDTLGGLVFTIVGWVPARGELVAHHSGIEFEVMDADARRVKTLKIHLAPSASDAPPSEPGS